MGTCAPRGIYGKEGKVGKMNGLPGCGGAARGRRRRSRLTSSVSPLVHKGNEMNRTNRIPFPHPGVAYAGRRRGRPPPSTVSSCPDRGRSSWRSIPVSSPTPTHLLAAPPFHGGSPGGSNTLLALSTDGDGDRSASTSQLLFERINCYGAWATAGKLLLP